VSWVNQFDIRSRSLGRFFCQKNSPSSTWRATCINLRAAAVSISSAYGSRVWAAPSSHCKAHNRYFPASAAFFRQISSLALLPNLSSFTGATRSSHPNNFRSSGKRVCSAVRCIGRSLPGPRPANTITYVNERSSRVQGHSVLFGTPQFYRRKNPLLVVSFGSGRAKAP